MADEELRIEARKLLESKGWRIREDGFSIANAESPDYVDHNSYERSGNAFDLIRDRRDFLVAKFYGTDGLGLLRGVVGGQGFISTRNHHPGPGQYTIDGSTWTKVGYTPEQEDKILDHLGVILTGKPY